MNQHLFSSCIKSSAIRLSVGVFLLLQAMLPTPARAERLLPENNNAALAAAIGGCSLFPADNIWNTRVDNLPVHARSGQWINNIGGTTGFHMDFGTEWEGDPIGIPYNVVGSGVPKVSVIFDYDDESDPGPYPIPNNPLIEAGSDGHILIVDSSTCTLYELFAASYSGGQWHAGSGAIWNLNSNGLRPDEWTSADAAGLPILPGLVRYDEVLSGEIDHAIRFTASSTNDYIWPARHLTSDDPDTPEIPPMGARFRLKADYDISGFAPQLQVILQAMKTYGIILADNGSDWYVSGAPDSRWNDETLHDLDVLTGDDFEAVDTSTLMVDYDSGATPALLYGNPAPPEETAKLIFIHHSTGQNWLTDDYGNLGRALDQNNYFVSDTNYGWGPNAIGDRTDIPNWTEWFASVDTPAYMAALFAEHEQHSTYTRLLANPGGENEIIMFKSCFPNSNLAGNPDDPPDPEGWLTVGHAKYVYNEILNQYFVTHPNKFFVVITAPPLQNGTYAANARAFNQWLMNDWLDSYTLNNVFVFDFYNVLTGPDAHHRYLGGEIDYVQGSQNTLYYDSNGDDHPNVEGSQKATEEFVPLLNVYYHRWKDGDTTPPTVGSVVRADGDPTSASSVDFTVTFSEPVTNVDASDFLLDVGGTIAGAEITDVTGSNAIRTVTVNTGTGSGTLGLNVRDTADISDLADNLLDNVPYTGDEFYTIDRLLPGPFDKTAPVNGWGGYYPSSRLSWSASLNAESYEYCIDTVNNGACDGTWISTGLARSAAPGGLSLGRTYYWQVRSVRAGAYTHANGGTWWSYSTRTGNFNKSSPVNGGGGYAAGSKLMWTVSQGAASYEYCIDQTNDDACEGDNWIDVGTSRSVAPAGVLLGRTYYWQVRSQLAGAYTYANSGTWWSYSTRPGNFNKSVPADGATGVSRSPTLTWTVSSGAAEYQYCIDTTPGTTCSTSWVSTGTSRTAALTGLNPNTTYYWQVRSLFAGAYTYANSSTWRSFRTGP